MPDNRPRAKQSSAYHSDIVHMVIDYWGGPIKGVADYRSNPHYFKALFDEEKDDWSDVFLLTPLNSETFQLFLESNRIWLRWKEAHERGQASDESHPALPEDRERMSELDNLISQKLENDKHLTIRARATFQPDDSKKPKIYRQWRVTWLEVPDSK